MNRVRAFLGGLQMAKWSIEVKRTGRTWSVFGRMEDKEDELLEGGFFSESVAMAARDRWEKDCIQSEVEDAERKAGWDPNP